MSHTDVDACYGLPGCPNRFPEGPALNVRAKPPAAVKCFYCNIEQDQNLEGGYCSKRLKPNEQSRFMPTHDWRPVDLPEGPALNVRAKPAPSMLEEAAAQVKDRRATYGSPAPNFRRIADFWNVYWRHRVPREDDDSLFFDPIDVATMMRLVKEARLIETPDHRDSLVDIAGYADCQIECVNDAKCSKENTGG